LIISGQKGAQVEEFYNADDGNANGIIQPFNLIGEGQLEQANWRRFDPIVLLRRFAALS
jgi:hypothetical protein